MDRAKKATIFGAINLTIWTAAVVAGVIMVAVAVMGGCSAHTKLDPPSTNVSVTTTDFDGQTGKAVRTTVEKVESKGPGGQASGDKATVDAKGKAPSVKTRSIETGEGGIDASADASIEKSMTARVIVGVIGVLLILAGCTGLYLRQPIKAASGTAIIGLGLFVCACFPSIALYTLAGLALYAAVSLWLAGFDAAKFREALRADRAGIADLAATHPDAHEALVDPDPKHGLIATHAEGGDLKTIAKIDHKDGLKN